MHFTHFGGAKMYGKYTDIVSTRLKGLRTSVFSAQCMDPDPRVLVSGRILLQE